MKSEIKESLAFSYSADKYIIDKFGKYGKKEIGRWYFFDNPKRFKHYPKKFNSIVDKVRTSTSRTEDALFNILLEFKYNPNRVLPTVVLDHNTANCEGYTILYLLLAEEIEGSIQPYRVVSKKPLYEFLPGIYLPGHIYLIRELEDGSWKILDVTEGRTRIEKELPKSSWNVSCSVYKTSGKELIKKYVEEMIGSLLFRGLSEQMAKNLEFFEINRRIRNLTDDILRYLEEQAAKLIS